MTQPPHIRSSPTIFIILSQLPLNQKRGEVYFPAVGRGITNSWRSQRIAPKGPLVRGKLRWIVDNYVNLLDIFMGFKVISINNLGNSWHLLWHLFAALILDEATNLLPRTEIYTLPI